MGPLLKTARNTGALPAGDLRFIRGAEDIGRLRRGSIIAILEEMP